MENQRNYNLGFVVDGVLRAATPEEREGMKAALESPYIRKLIEQIDQELLGLFYQAAGFVDSQTLDVLRIQQQAIQSILKVLYAAGGMTLVQFDEQFRPTLQDSPEQG